MRRFWFSVAAIALIVTSVHAQRGGAPAAPAPPDLVRPLVGRLDLEKYKATLKGLTQFGDRRQGTKRNRDAVDWIEAQLRSYGCQNIERVTYDWQPPTRRVADSTAAARTQATARNRDLASGGGRLRGVRTRTG